MHACLFVHHASCHAPMLSPQELMARLLKLTEALLMGGGVACRQVARKLAVVCYSAFANQGPHEPVGPDGEDAWVSWGALGGWDAAAQV